ncbi:S53 family peptidase [Flexivirga caeni]|uniref:Peptidase S53 n=1 Tax=Flexivirga caeni TaxID=2294115 RepID=A0A3M9MDA0_9MICO|nr:S53 family peptidase [Flexivirga caeni]RNI22813.1 peptidase S53 [Flexivirga caeni]
MNIELVELPGSVRSTWAGALADLSPETTVVATLVLRRRGALPPYQPGQAPLTSSELAERYGADPADVAAVRAAVTEAGLTVLGERPESRTVRVSGPAPVIAAFFGTQLHAAHESSGDRTWRVRDGALSVPAALRGVVTAVLGLDNRPQAATRHIVADPKAVATSYTPLQLATIYGMPQADGTGQTIAIVELGGGFGQSDLDTYFRGLGLATPTVTAREVDGAKNTPGRAPQGADGEVLLDIEVAGAIAPKASVVVYFAPNTDAGFLDAITAATHASPAPVAMSISWGQSEDQWTAQARTAMDDAFADAVALGITVTVAAGDNGSADNDTSGSGTHVDFPASSPHVLGCGGTSLHASGGRVQSETVWNDGGSGGATGGGVSDVFALPAWQSAAGVPQPTSATGGRGVPDVAGDADPQTGYQVYVDGSATVIGGTSAVAPLWAGLIARIAQVTGKRPGLAQTALYAGVAPGKPVTALRDITSGSNGAFSAGPGWDACTGLGVPDPSTVTAFGG